MSGNRHRRKGLLPKKVPVIGLPRILSPRPCSNGSGSGSSRINQENLPMVAVNTDAVDVPCCNLESNNQTRMTWESLPSLILLKILLMLQSKDLATCRAVCNSWQAVIQTTSRLLRKLQVQLRDARTLKEIVDFDSNILWKSFCIDFSIDTKTIECESWIKKFGPNIQELTFNRFPRTPISLVGIKNIVLQCPKLDSLVFGYLEPTTTTYLAKDMRLLSVLKKSEVTQFFSRIISFKCARLSYPHYTTILAQNFKNILMKMRNLKYLHVDLPLGSNPQSPNFERKVLAAITAHISAYPLTLRMIHIPNMYMPSINPRSISQECSLLIENRLSFFKIASKYNIYVEGYTFPLGNLVRSVNEILPWHVLSITKAVFHWKNFPHIFEFHNNMSRLLLCKNLSVLKIYFLTPYLRITELLDLPSIEELYLRIETNKEIRYATDIIESLGSKPHPNLKKLEIIQTLKHSLLFSPETVTMFSRNHPQLTSLSISCGPTYAVNDITVGFMFKYLTQLEYLELRDGKLTDEGMTGVKRNNSPFEYADIIESFLLFHDAATHYVNASTNIDLSVISSHQTPVTPKASICQLKKLRQLKLFNVQITDVTLFYALRHMNLTVLHLNSCKNITDLGLKSLASGDIRDTLVELELMSNITYSFIGISSIMKHFIKLRKMNTEYKGFLEFQPHQ